MQTLTDLTEHFAIPGVLAFTQTEAGLLRATVTTPACTAELYLHGAHLTAWAPAAHKPVLFLSDRSLFAPDKAIRGGVPLIFPWFGPRTGARTDGPMHGFARITTWTVAFAAVAGEDLHLTLTLGPSDETRALGFDHFQAAFTLVLGQELRMKFTVANEGSEPMSIEEAFHTYFTVGDVEKIAIEGLSGTKFLDKTDGFKRKTQTEEPLRITQWTDRPYLNTAAAVTIVDPVLQRKIVVAKSNSLTTVVWNPWVDVAAKTADLDPDSWHGFVCVETANAAENAVTVAPRSAHTMEAHISVESLA